MITEKGEAAKDTLFLEPRHYDSLLRILATQAGDHRVWAFGSRATDKFRWRYSDLDLAIEGELTKEQRAALSHALENSLLPVRVDIVELELADKAFVARIRPDFVLVRQPTNL